MARLSSTETVLSDLQPVINNVHLKLTGCPRLLVIMRGLPGSGKSTLAKALHTQFGGNIHSADFCFLKSDRSGERKYAFDPSQLQDAHAECKRQAFKSLEAGIHLVIIDNTNLEKWQMEPYVVKALECDYNVELLEPVTQWRYKVKTLANCNTHGVSLEKLKDMHSKFSRNFDIPEWIESIRRKHSIKLQQSAAATKGAENRKLKTPQKSPSTSSSHQNLEAFREVARQVDPSTIWADLKEERSCSAVKLSPPFAAQPVVPDGERMVSVCVGDSAFCTSVGQERDIAAVYCPFKGPNPVYRSNQFHRESQTDSYLFPRWDAEMCLRRIYEIFPDLPRANLEYMLDAYGGDFELAVEAIAETDPILMYQSSCASQQPQEQSCTESPRPPCNNEEVPGNCSAHNLSSLVEMFPKIPADKLRQFLDLTGGDIDWASALILDANPNDLLDTNLRSGASQPAQFVNNDSSQLCLDKQFLKYLHDNFKSRFKLDYIDLDSVPLGAFVPSKTLAENIYKEFMQQLGVLESDISGKIKYENNRIEANSLWNVPRRPNVPLREIMHEEEAMEKSLQEKRKQDLDKFASKLSLLRLQQKFPDIEADYLQDIYLQNKSNETETLHYLLESGHTVKEDREGPIKEPMLEVKKETEKSGETLFKEIQSVRQQHDIFVQKMKTMSSKDKQSGIASYYSQELRNLWAHLVHLEDQHADVLLCEQRKRQGARRIDLHHMSVRCALRALRERVQELTPTSGGSCTLHVVTGLGRHSKVKAKVKPAVANWLANKNLHFSETTDGGQLIVKLTG